MNESTHGKKLARELQNTWDMIVRQENLDRETDYRIQKLVLRINPLMDKIFLKTTKACQLLLKCLEMTERFQKQISFYGKSDYYLLTVLEKTFEELIIKTYQFRVKAG